MRAYFKEETRFGIIWFILFLLFGVLPFVGVLLMLINDKTNDRTEFVIAMSVMTIVMIALGAVLRMSKLNLEIRDGLLRYKSFPYLRSWREIKPEEILNWEVKKVNPVTYAGGWGYRYRLLTNKTSIIMKGKVGLELRLENGKTIFFSTSNSEELERQMKKFKNEEALS